MDFNEPIIGSRERSCSRTLLFATSNDRKVWGRRQGNFVGQSEPMEGKEVTVTKPKEKEGKGKKIGRPQKTLSTEQIKTAIEAARLGIPMERIAIGCGFHDGGGTWALYLQRNPSFANQIREAQFKGELELASVVRDASVGWQGSAWLLERTRGYVARAQLEHTGKGGKDLSISGALLGAFGNTK